jgi:hypothetical protein
MIEHLIIQALETITKSYPGSGSVSVIKHRPAKLFYGLFIRQKQENSLQTELSVVLLQKIIRV